MRTFAPSAASHLAGIGSAHARAGPGGAISRSLAAARNLLGAFEAAHDEDSFRRRNLQEEVDAAFARTLGGGGGGGGRGCGSYRLGLRRLIGSGLRPRRGGSTWAWRGGRWEGPLGDP